MLLDLPGYTLAIRAYEGSETVLYRGRREADGAPVAVKVKRNEYPTARELARLRREFAILEDLGGLPGVVRAYSLEKCGRGLALVMEDLGAVSLDDLRKARTLDVEGTLKIAVSLADTLGELHQRSVIHKDIKPHNIMIDEATLVPRLIDFGIAARLSRETPKATSPTALEGTLAYMSPEQTGRMNRAVDLRADLYSLGATLFQVLTGALPFPTTNPIELIHSHIARSPTPPHEQAKEVPQILSDIVMRLLAKTPEERYQSARGLKVDLERCLSQWTATRQMDPFPLAQEDISGELRIPQKLYGRERDIEALLAAFERARRGATELVLVSGYSGVGKSAMVNELYKPIARLGGAFVRGKFDPSRHHIPLAPVAHALRDLVRQILPQSAATLDGWKRVLLDAVGPNGRVLFDLIPELELVIGPQPDVPALGPNEARNRFDLLVQRFLRVFATAEHPLAIFLDDLQWADPASLRLLGFLLGDPDSKHLLLVGAYRDNEVDAAHPLLSTLDELRKAGATIAELKLRPLNLSTVTQLIAETLRQPEPEIAELSALLFDKTHGNPFFLSQLLGALHEERVLSFDAASGAFTWDLARVREAMVTDNVVDLMLRKLHQLAPTTQQALQLAACIGHEFDLGALSIIQRKSPTNTAADLWEALREGLILPLDGDYRFLDVSAGASPESDAGDFQVSYRFLHDRVREAAYALIPEERKEEVHLSIGRLLWAQSGEPPRDEDLLEIVQHLHLGASGILDEDEQISVARLHLRAGRKAKAATAYKSAADHFAAGIELLGLEGWERDYPLCFSLHAEGAECAYLSGALEQAESLFDVILPRASSSVEQARIHNLRVILYTTLGKFTEAMKAGLAGLACVGVTLPETQAEQQAAFGSGLAEIAAALSGRRIEDLLDAPVLDDPEQRAEIQLLGDLELPSFYVKPLLHPTIVLRRVTISLKHGHADISSSGYMSYGFILAVVLGRPAEGHAFGKLALALNEKFRNASLAAKLLVTFAAFLYACEPLRAAIPYCQAAHRAAIECGDFVFLSTNCLYTPLMQMGAGYPLDEIRDEVEEFLVLMQRTRDMTTTAALTIMKQTIASLEGRTRSRTSLSDQSFDEERFVATLDDKNQRVVLFHYYVLKLQGHLLYGEIEAALAVTEKAEQASESAVGSYLLTRFDFYACLALLSLPAAETAEEGERREAAIARHRAKLAGFAATCPKNFQHQLLLIDAEAARRSGKHADAMDLYDEAITLAKENEFPQDEALANELCAKMYVAIGRPRAARGYMGDAYLGYLHWGALAKAEHIKREHAHLLPSLAAGAERRAVPSASSSLTTTTLMGQIVSGDLRDTALVVRAAQAIASEIALAKVMERLSEIVLESAGAERGALLLEQEGRLFVEATFGVGPELLQLGPLAALETRSDLAQSVALFVARTRELVVLDDAQKDGRFAGDPHIAAGHVKSLLCLPLLYQGRLSGLLYLESKKAEAVFHATRIELLKLFSSQAAIAIENARMVADVREANDQVRRANERLESEVAQRTEELRATAQRLRSELAQREQAERERAALQEQMIEAQRARLAEMSTPLIPITNRIMVMPLIGTVDTERAAQVMEVALQGATRHQAHVVILDVTGINQIDTYVIRTLLNSAAALRLLGTQSVLTGIRPEVAQTMVQIGADLGNIVTKGTLQSGIAYALRLSGELVAAGS
jgi:predicted ATPase/GAF domain-containing protein/tRNA A-37 threonylcarbamoyl transferase component Bud32